MEDRCTNETPSQRYQLRNKTRTTKKETKIAFVEFFLKQQTHRSSLVEILIPHWGSIIVFSSSGFGYFFARISNFKVNLLRISVFIWPWYSDFDQFLLRSSVFHFRIRILIDFFGLNDIWQNYLHDYVCSFCGNERNKLFI